MLSGKNWLAVGLIGALGLPMSINFESNSAYKGESWSYGRKLAADDKNAHLIFDQMFRVAQGENALDASKDFLNDYVLVRDEKHLFMTIRPKTSADSGKAKSLEFLKSSKQADGKVFTYQKFSDGTFQIWVDKKPAFENAKFDQKMLTTAQSTASLLRFALEKEILNENSEPTSKGIQEIKDSQGNVIATYTKQKNPDSTELVWKTDRSTSVTTLGFHDINYKNGNKSKLAENFDALLASSTESDFEKDYGKFHVKSDGQGFYTISLVQPYSTERTSKDFEETAKIEAKRARSLSDILKNQPIDFNVLNKPESLDELRTQLEQLQNTDDKQAKSDSGSTKARATQMRRDLFNNAKISTEEPVALTWAEFGKYAKNPTMTTDSDKKTYGFSSGLIDLACAPLIKVEFEELDRKSPPPTHPVRIWKYKYQDAALNEACKEGVSNGCSIGAKSKRVSADCVSIDELIDRNVSDMQEDENGRLYKQGKYDGYISLRVESGDPDLEGRVKDHYFAANGKSVTTTPTEDSMRIISDATKAKSERAQREADIKQEFQILCNDAVKDKSQSKLAELASFIKDYSSILGHVGNILDEIEKMILAKDLEDLENAFLEAKSYAALDKLLDKISKFIKENHLLSGAKYADTKASVLVLLRKALDRTAATGQQMADSHVFIENQTAKMFDLGNRTLDLIEVLEPSRSINVARHGISLEKAKWQARENPRQFLNDPVYANSVRKTMYRANNSLGRMNESAQRSRDVDLQNMISAQGQQFQSVMAYRPNPVLPNGFGDGLDEIAANEITGGRQMTMGGNGMQNSMMPQMNQSYLPQQQLPWQQNNWNTNMPMLNGSPNMQMQNSGMNNIGVL